MVERVPFLAEHAARIKLQPCQLEGASYASPAHYVQLAKTPAFTLLDGDEVLMCAGAIPVWPGRSVCWAMLAESIGHRMVHCVREAVRFMHTLQKGRYEMDVEAGHEEGRRMARAMGFSLETERMVSYYPNGNDASMFVRVTHD